MGMGSCGYSNFSSFWDDFLNLIFLKYYFIKKKLIEL